MMVIGQIEITSKCGCEGLFVYVRDVSVTRIFFYDHYVFKWIIWAFCNYEALSDPLHIDQFKGVLKG